MKTKLIAEDLWFPEGPIWLADNSWLVVEIRRQTLTRIGPDGQKSIVAKLGGGPNGAAIGPDGYCYVCNNGGLDFRQRSDGAWVNHGQPAGYTTGRIERVNVETGKFEILYDHIDGQRIKGANDLVFDHHGGFYFTDPGKTRSSDSDRGTVYYAKSDGSGGWPVIFPISRPNGIGLSPDGQTLYVAETETARLWAWDLQEPGRLKNQTTATVNSPHGGRLIHLSPVYARFDSLGVQEDGGVCVANLDRGGITVCSADGQSATFIPIPGDTHITNICWGTSNMKKAYVTQSYAGRLVEVDWPTPGLKLNYS
jgi:gluconolactonase